MNTSTTPRSFVATLLNRLNTLGWFAETKQKTLKRSGKAQVAEKMRWTSIAVAKSAFEMVTVGYAICSGDT